MAAGEERGLTGLGSAVMQRPLSFTNTAATRSLCDERTVHPGAEGADENVFQHLASQRNDGGGTKSHLSVVYT